MTASVQTSFPRVDAVLGAFATPLGGDLDAYRNHVHRVLNYFVALAPGAIPEAVVVAAAFHDLGIWTDDTFDYLAPSERLAADYLEANDLTAFAPEVRAIIFQHHKLTPYRGPFAATVEAFRRADLVDVSLGFVRPSVPRTQVRAVRAAFPNAGFHRRLLALTCRQLLRTPLRPLPMLRW
jgi:hypothetical protein